MGQFVYYNWNMFRNKTMSHFKLKKYSKQFHEILPEMFQPQLKLSNYLEDV